jgi:hypothetical protein
MARKDGRTTAIELTTKAQAPKQPTDVNVRQEISDIFGGTLYVVNWTSAKDSRDFDSFVFVDSRNTSHFFFNPTELTRFLNQTQSSRGSGSLFDKLLASGGVPAVIAMAITATICYLVVARDLKEVPSFLSNAWSIILGFYFGRRVTEGGKKEDAL